MGLPALAKTWQHNANNAIAAQGSAELCVDAFWLAVKNALLAFASNPWTVVSSSDGVTSGASDLWTDASKLVHHGTTRSWIVLKQTGMCSGNFQLCIDFNNATASTGTVVVSPNAGFTGGSTTARPTATDEYALISTSMILQLFSDVGTRWTVMQTSDGACTRILMAHGGSVRTTILLETPNNATTGWSNAFSVLWLPNSAATIADLISTYNWKSRFGSTNATCVTLVEGFATALGPSDTTWGNIANEISSEWPMWPLGFAANTVGARGRHGSFFDLWAGSSGVAAGDTYPGDGSNQFVQWGALIVPWGGGAVNLS